MLPDWVDAAIENFAGLVWGLPMIFLLAGTGVFFSLYFSGVQFRAFGHAINVVTGKYDKATDPGEISHFRALCTALSATVGLGNIAGVGVAIHVGGPGATFWMIVTGLVGMATKYAECTLGVRYRRIDENGRVRGGPMHYIDLALGPKFKVLAIWYSVGVIFGTFGPIALFQSNQVADIVNSSFGVEHYITGFVLAFLTGLVIIGGIKRIGAVAARIVPLMALLYFGGAFAILVQDLANIPAMLYQILNHAFTGTAVGGAAVGILVKEVLIQGMRRAAFSNEAGLGTAAIAHSAVKTKEPVREGVVALLEPFIDTVVICTLTALVIISSGLWDSELNGIQLSSAAFEAGLPGFGIYFLPVAVSLFAFSSLTSWYYYGEQAWGYLFGERGLIPYKCVYLFLIVVGSVWALTPVINLSDAIVGLTVVPNLIALLLLAPTIKKMTVEYFAKLKKGEFD
jgi:AGCS family alanine or glycine:cation symporter